MARSHHIFSPRSELFAALHGHAYRSDPTSRRLSLDQARYFLACSPFPMLTPQSHD